MDNYSWVPIYKKIAIKLLQFKNDRKRLLNIMYEILEEIDKFSDEDEKNCNLDTYQGKRCRFDDFDPFSFMNRLSIYSKENKQLFIKKFEEKTGMEIEIPNDFNGVPIVSSFNSCLILHKDDRGENDINELWELFETAINLTTSKNLTKTFIKQYDQVINKDNIGYNLSISLFLINPDFYLSLDSKSRRLIKKKFNINIKDYPSGTEYLKIIIDVKKNIKETNEFKNLVDFSYHSWLDSKNDKKNIWLYSPGENASFWDNCVKNNIMVIGWDNLGNLKKYKTEDEIYKKIKEEYNKENPIHDKCACSDFVNKIKEGDIVIAKKGKKELLGYGTVESDYYYDNTRDIFKHTRKVKWIKIGNWINNTDTENASKTLTEISQYPGYPEKLLNIINGIENTKIKKETIKYWWLNASPSQWSYSNIKEGEEQDYSFYNENGNKRRIFKNFEEVKIGDKVIGYEASPTLKILSLGTISKVVPNQYITFKKEEDLICPISYSYIKNIEELKNMEFLNNFSGSLFKLTANEYEILIDIIRETNPEKKYKIEKYTKKDFLDDVFIEEDEYEELVETLKNKKNIILQGPPGVGKTYAAKKLAYSMMEYNDDSRVKIIQFHQSYSYEDFIYGYKPVEDGFEAKEGVFYSFCELAKRNPDKDYFFIIDEINRGNLSKIFGEALMAIEKDYRGKKCIELAYNNIPFEVPERLYIIGMMNTADRSLTLIDYALRRRFAFFDLTPAYEKNKFQKYIKGLNNNELNKLCEIIRDLNKEIKNDESLKEGFMIGHSYLSNFKNEEIPDLKIIVKYEILPLIKEYWYDNEENYKKWEIRLKNSVGIQDDK